MRKLVIFGTKTLADMVYYLFSSDSDYEVAAFSLDGEYVKEDTYQGLPVIPFEELSQAYSPEDADVFVAVGIAKVNQLRAAKIDQVAGAGYRLASFMSSQSSAPRDFVLQPNTMLMDQVSIHPGAQIGSGSILWTRSCVSLQSKVGNNCWLTSASIGHSVVVGDNSFLGVNSTVASFVTVGKRNVIGAGATVLENTPDDAVIKSVENKPSRVPSYRLSFLK